MYISPIPRHKLRPHVKRERINRGLTDVERSVAAHPRRSLVEWNSRCSLRDRTWNRPYPNPSGLLVIRPRQELGQGTGHIRSRAHPAFKIALREKLSIGVQHRDS